MASTKTADEQVLEILRRSTIDDKGILLPDQLERPVYQKVNKFLEMAGAKWNRSAGRHTFTGTAKADILALLETGSVTDKKQLFQEFFTPKGIAEQVVDYAGIEKGMNCLEPSAGHGAIALKMREAGGIVSCVELNPESADKLRSLGFKAITCDFLDYNRQQSDVLFDRICMNPPFTQNQAYLHVLCAFKMLKPGGSLVSIVPRGNPRGKALKAEWDELIDSHCDAMIDLDPGAFKESGTSVSTQIIILSSPESE